MSEQAAALFISLKHINDYLGFMSKLYSWYWYVDPYDPYDKSETLKRDTNFVCYYYVTCIHSSIFDINIWISVYGNAYMFISHLINRFLFIKR